VLEEDAVRAQAIDGGSLDAAVAVSRQAIRAQRVDRDQEHRRLVRRARQAVSASSEQQESAGRGGIPDERHRTPFIQS
jgi:hypothetical protein